MSNCQSEVSRIQADKQSSVQRLLGLSLLRLQEYEALLKQMLLKGHISGPPAEIPELLQKKSSSLQKKMMGELVGNLTKTFFAVENASDLERTVPEPANNIAWVEAHAQIVFSQERYAVVKPALEQLVSLRNELVHHFIHKFDLNSLEGCTKAESFLQQSHANIEENLTLLRTWNQSLEEIQAKLVSLLSEREFKDVLDGIHPDKTVDWSRAGIVQGLRDAEDCLANNSWTDLSAAILWMSENAPEQRPKRYGCSSWRQVIHESGQFEVRKQAPAGLLVNTAAHQAMSLWYRSRRRLDAH
ncbi:OST-HTH/LOTUS domain-containing protein [Massilia sp. LC238]|uniref:OST-HTH/LOTUS domain-containing protein n=1 Tax=Massilia sp. LC238 TaxID=1502852 RepID=UPI0004E3C955|nr:OST-HTH/LOTUS domain-containing protein [Massilia sp. LC238]KFC62334.1 OST-HTH/LOTUS domain protein [Massilia sp. LC238]